MHGPINIRFATVFCPLSIRYVHYVSCQWFHQNCTPVPNLLRMVYRTSDCMVEFKTIALIMELIIPSPPPLYFGAIYNCIYIYIYMTIRTHKAAWPLPVTPHCTTDPCMLHRPAPHHITSGNFTNCSRTVFGLHIQIHKSKSHWLFHKPDNLCLFVQMWYLSTVILRVWFSGNVSFHSRSPLHRQSEM